MPLFVCDNCGCIDNTACGGTWWSRNMTDIWPKEYVGKALCVVCASPVYNDGSPNTDAGEWHNHFPRKQYTPDRRDDVLNPPREEDRSESQQP